MLFSFHYHELRMAAMQELQRSLLSFNSHLQTVVKFLNLHWFRKYCIPSVRCMALSKLPHQAEQSDEACGSLTRVIRNPNLGAFLPSRLFISISYDIWSKVSKLPAVQKNSSLLQLHDLLDTAAKLSYSWHDHCEGKPAWAWFCLHHYKGYRNAQAHT